MPFLVLLTFLSEAQDLKFLLTPRYKSLDVTSEQSQYFDPCNGPLSHASITILVLNTTLNAC